jgi:hypothetical protein
MGSTRTIADICMGETSGAGKLSSICSDRSKGGFWVEHNARECLELLVTSMFWIRSSLHGISGSGIHMHEYH